jgi:hypothetical protein
VPPTLGAAASYRLMFGLAVPLLVSLFGAPTQAPSKNREEGGALALGGHQSIKIFNNHLIIGGSGMGDVRSEVRRGGSTGGGTPSNHLGCRIKRKNNNNTKYIVAFGCHRLTPYHPTTNQKHAGMVEASVDRRFGWAGMQGGY